MQFYKKKNIIKDTKHLFRYLKKLLSILIKLFFLKKLIVGSGGTYYSGWVPTDKDFLDITSEKDWLKILFAGKLKAVLMEHVFEHFTEEESKKVLKNIFQNLRKEGYLRIAVPDGFHPDINYINHVKPGGVGSGADDHKFLYTYKTLTCLLESAGFRCNLLEYWDEKSEFHHNNWSVNNGMITRSFKFDNRNKNGKPNYTSLIIDAYK